jgi:hypothetical protein
MRSKTRPSAADALSILLPVSDLTQSGRLVIQTLAVSVAARVQIDDLSLVW